MSEKYKVHNPGDMCFITLTVADRKEQIPEKFSLEADRNRNYCGMNGLIMVVMIE
ncbi:MAG: hypothetical protein JW973_07070 [Bacteroidales bacterium]|nr:hypothetical protein [Bacteroidales bacterium]